jgi:hypothetical protein
MKTVLIVAAMALIAENAINQERSLLAALKRSFRRA